MQDPRGQRAFPRPTRPLVWLIAAGLGAGAALLAAIIGIFGVFFVLLIVPGMGARTWLTATSGVLTGFGATMLALLLVRTPNAGAAGDDGTLLMLAGAIPLVIGLALGALALVTARSTPS
jgi:hypothetical protein